MENSRRKFIGNSAKAMLAFTIIPRHVMGGVGFLAPSDVLNLGFIGTGKQARGLLNSFKDKANIVAGADVDMQKLHRFHLQLEQYHLDLQKAGKGGKFNSFTAYEDYRELLQRKDIDAVVIASPDHWHAWMAVDAALAGKHIYCEKPLAHTVAEGRWMVNAARRNNVVFQTGSMQRSWKNFRHASELVRNGYIGQIKEVLVSIGDPSRPCDLPSQPVRLGLNWDQWIGPAPYREFSPVLAPPPEDEGFPKWRDYKEYGGGMVTDWGAHMFDIAQWALGKDETGPVEFIPPTPNGKRGMKMVYADGIVMKHEDFGKSNMVRFIGEKGKIDISRGAFESDPASLVSATVQPGEVRLYESNDHYRDWLDCIKTGKRPICDVEIGHRTSSLCNNVNLAYELGRPLKWNPQTEQFVNDDEANLKAAPVFREGWEFPSLPNGKRRR